MESPNLFKALFAYRPRSAQVLRKEDFLTAGFAYVLATNPGFARAFCARCMAGGTPLDPDATPVVQTWRRFNRPGGDGQIIPDMLMQCRARDGSQLTMIFEHKWECPADQAQLANYRTLAAQLGFEPRVIFIGATSDQAQIAASACDLAMTWREVHDLLKPFVGASIASQEFIDFLKGEGLGPETGCAELDIRRCELMSKVIAGFDWGFLPARFRNPQRESRKRWGRVGVELGQWLPETAPGFLAGFLLDGRDHRVDILDQQCRIDLLMELDVGTCTEQLPPNVLSRCADRLRKLEPSVRVLDGWECRNRKQALSVQEPLSAVVGVGHSADEQIERVYARFERWGTILFEDGSLEAALDAAWPPM